jgi:hypothetical protein
MGIAIEAFWIFCIIGRMENNLVHFPGDEKEIFSQIKPPLAKQLAEEERSRAMNAMWLAGYLAADTETNQPLKRQRRFYNENEKV